MKIKRTSGLVKEDAIAAELNPQQLQINAEPANPGELEKIIKTTDSMNIIASLGLGRENGQATSQSRAELANIRESIYRSFDLARRKITTEYEQIVVSGNYVDNPFLAVQVVLKNYERNWNIQIVESIIKKFTDAIPEQLALGKTVYLSEDLTIEPITYIDKILPTWKITPNFALLANALRWEDIVNKLTDDGELTHDAKEIVKEAIDAITLNVSNGYYIKISRLIIMQLSLGVNQKLILFSNDTLQKMNEIYTRFMKTGEKKQINKYDTLAHFERTRENIERGFYNDDVKVAEQSAEAEFIPQDLVAEIAPDASGTSFMQESTLTPFEKVEEEDKLTKEAEEKVKVEKVDINPDAPKVEGEEELILEPLTSTGEVKLEVKEAAEDEKNVEIVLNEPQEEKIVAFEAPVVKTKEQLKAEAKAAKIAEKEAKKAAKKAAKEGTLPTELESVPVANEEAPATPAETPELILEENAETPAPSADATPSSDEDFFAAVNEEEAKTEKPEKKSKKKK